MMPILYDFFPVSESISAMTSDPSSTVRRPLYGVLNFLSSDLNTAAIAFLLITLGLPYLGEPPEQIEVTDF